MRDKSFQSLLAFTLVYGLFGLALLAGQPKAGAVRTGRMQAATSGTLPISAGSPCGWRQQNSVQSLGRSIQVELPSAFKGRLQPPAHRGRRDASGRGGGGERRDQGHASRAPTSSRNGCARPRLA